MMNRPTSQKGLFDGVADSVQTGLGVLGMLPVAGAIPDLINAGISATRGDWTGAGMSAFSAIPGIGDAVGVANLARKAGKIGRIVGM